MGNFDFEMADLRAEQGLEIEPARKAALPSADTCIGCAQRLELLRGRPT